MITSMILSFDFIIYYIYYIIMSHSYLDIFDNDFENSDNHNESYKSNNNLNTFLSDYSGLILSIMSSIFFIQYIYN